MGNDLGRNMIGPFNKPKHLTFWASGGNVQFPSKEHTSIVANMNVIIT
jgi:hypothetical protein